METKDTVNTVLLKVSDDNKTNLSMSSQQISQGEGNLLTFWSQCFSACLLEKSKKIVFGK